MEEWRRVLGGAEGRLEVKVCVRVRSECVREAAVPLEERIVVLLDRVLNRGEEEHVLTEVREAWHVVGIIRGAGAHIHRCRCQRRGAIAHEDGLEGIAQLDKSVLAPIGRRFDDVRLGNVRQDEVRQDEVRQD